MVEPQDNEETPLLQHERLRQVLTTPKTPLPWDQFWVVLLLHVADPLGVQTLAPFTPQVSIVFCLHLSFTITGISSSSLETSE